jgi:hypothetical protein
MAERKSGMLNCLANQESEGFRTGFMTMDCTLVSDSGGSRCNVPTSSAITFNRCASGQDSGMTTAKPFCAAPTVMVRG